MRTLGALAVLSASVVFAFACSPSSDSEEGDVSEADITNLDGKPLATEALKILGAPTLIGPNDSPSCNFSGCHNINPVTVRAWKKQYDKALTVLKGDLPINDKINAFRANPCVTDSVFTAERLGIMAAGAHLAGGANVREADHPLAYAQGQMLSTLFEGKADLYDTFRRQMLMPVTTDYPRLSAAKYEIILKWFQQGLPFLDGPTGLLEEGDRNQTCRDDYDRLAAHASDVKTSNWAFENRHGRRKVAMLACPPGEDVDPIECFKNKAADGQRDIFPSSASLDWARTWAQDGSTVRVLRSLSAANSFWLRSSADGRFAATGGGRNGGAQAIDLQATLDGGVPALDENATKRDIGISATYDPDFWPDNKGFMFRGGSGGSKSCQQSLLEKPTTQKVTFNEAECKELRTQQSGSFELYQTVGQKIGDNSFGDRFIITNDHANDPGSYSANATDTPPAAGPTTHLLAFVAVYDEDENAYSILKTPSKVPMPYKGDTMLSRSTNIIASRYGTAQGGPLGYVIDKLDGTVAGPGQYNFGATEIGRVCMLGNKANFSFDERFLATHHYNPERDRPDDGHAEFCESGSADIYVSDFVAKKQMRVTKMNPGQFALFPHFRSDGWLYFLVVDQTTRKYYVAASDWAVSQLKRLPTP